MHRASLCASLLRDRSSTRRLVLALSAGASGSMPPAHFAGPDHHPGLRAGAPSYAPTLDDEDEGGQQTRFHRYSLEERLESVPGLHDDPAQTQAHSFAPPDFGCGGETIHLGHLHIH